MRSMRLIFGFVASLLPLAAPPSSADPDERDDGSWVFESTPIYCAAIGDDRHICTWHEGRSYHLVCELDSEGQLVEEPCIRRDDNVSMYTYPDRKVKKRSRLSDARMRRKLCQEEFSALEAAKSIRQVSEFVGAGPNWCQISGDALTCTWHAVRRTPGYISLARIVSTTHSKIDMNCKFKKNGQNREDGTCHAYIAGRTPPSTNQAPWLSKMPTGTYQPPACQ